MFRKQSGEIETTRMSRRHFLKLAGATAAAVVAAPSLSFGRKYSPIQYSKHGFSKAQGEEEIIRQAMNIVHTRFRSMDVLRNAYQVASRSHLGSGVYEASNLRHHPTYTGWDLLWAQIATLRQPNLSGHEDDLEFPNINIHAFHQRSDRWGQAPVGTVVVKYVQKHYWTTTGEFSVELNRWHLGTEGQGSDPEQWAAIIAHEMLHNLGHSHEEGEYGDYLQINAFERAVLYNGTYRRSASLSNGRVNLAQRREARRCGCGLALC